MTRKSHSGGQTRFFQAMHEATFYVALAILFTHELDAVSNQEWRVMPLVNSLGDDWGNFVFIAAHVPLFAVIIAIVSSLGLRTRRLARLAICGFLLIHAGLHLWFSSDPAYEFDSVLSGALIYGGAALGGLYLLLDYLNTGWRAAE